MWALIALNFDLNATGEELRLQAWLHKDLQIKDEGLSWQKDSEMWNQTESIGSSLQFYIDIVLSKIEIQMVWTIYCQEYEMIWSNWNWRSWDKIKLDSERTEIKWISGW